MRIYFSGIGGVGIGPLAEIAIDAGYETVGSDQSENLVTAQLKQRGVTLSHDQSGEFLRTEHTASPIDWFVYTAALPDDHPEIVTAQHLGIRVAKRDELLAFIIAEKNLKLIAVAGTHGKTTTTGMMVWTLKKLGIPVSYSIGTTLSWGPSGAYDPASEYFVYECDEFDRNFLHFHPSQSIITSIDYDHPDTYPTKQDYYDAFDQFIRQSDRCVLWQQDFDMKALPGSNTTVHMIDKNTESVRRHVDELRLAGRHNRENAYLVLTDCVDSGLDEQTVKAVLESFPGTNRRFEKLADNLYSDYGHHPVEIAATLQMAKEVADRVVLVYQPHQNVRQHEIAEQYTDEIFKNANEIYWLPTYLSREDPELEVLTPHQLTKNLTRVTIADLDDTLWADIEKARGEGALVLLMGAGTIDSWARNHLQT